MSDYEKASTLAGNVMAVVDEYGFDGVDVDWEYPTEAEYIANESTFVSLLRRQIDERGGLLLTAAVPSTAWAFEVHDVPRLCRYCDYLNVMTYDHHINDPDALHHTAPREDGTGKYDGRGYSNELTAKIFCDLDARMA